MSTVHLELIYKILTGDDLVWIDEDGNTGLMLACMEGGGTGLYKVRTLLDNGYSNIDAINNECTALMIACKKRKFTHCSGTTEDQFNGSSRIL